MSTENYFFTLDGLDNPVYSASLNKNNGKACGAFIPLLSLPLCVSNFALCLFLLFKHCLLFIPLPTTFCHLRFSHKRTHFHSHTTTCLPSLNWPLDCSNFYKASAWLLVTINVQLYLLLCHTSCMQLMQTITSVDQYKFKTATCTNKFPKSKKMNLMPTKCRCHLARTKRKNKLEITIQL